MKMKTALLGVFVASVSLTALLVAQQPATPGEGHSQMMQGKGMMSGAMMGQAMMSGHQEMSKLVDQVTADLAALQNENDLATIKTKLAADQSLLEQFQNHMQHQRAMIGPMMERMKMMDKEGTPAK
jgi:hypothetical protein